MEIEGKREGGDSEEGMMDICMYVGIYLFICVCICVCMYLCIYLSLRLYSSLFYVFFLSLSNGAASSLFVLYS